jgi:hypothetical protein
MRSAQALGFVLWAALAAACRAGATDQPEPVAECQAYERAFARCTGIDAPIATQPEALAATDEAREHLKKVCSANLERLMQNCR